MDRQLLFALLASAALVLYALAMLRAGAPVRASMTEARSRP